VDISAPCINGIPFNPMSEVADSHA
jgi:hypothetical protein